MPLNDALRTRMDEPDFWPLYFFEDEPDEPDDEDEDDDEEPEDEHRAEFGLGDGLSLDLDLDLATGYFSLGLTAPGLAEPVELGWDDQAHFHPHVLRWAELDLLGRAMALRDPELRHPGPLLALLLRFAFLDERDDPDTIAPLVDAAFRLVRPQDGDDGGGVRSETRDWYELRNLSDAGLRWTTTPGGHPAVAQDDRVDADALLYSLRSPDNEEFPFAEWAALTERAEQIVTDAASAALLSVPDVRDALERCTAPRGHRHVAALAEALRAAGCVHPVLLRAFEEPVSRAESCWAVEVLAGMPQGTLVKRWFGRSPLADARSWNLALTIDHEGRSDPSVKLAEELHDALQRAGLGGAEIGGGTARQTSDGGSQWVSTRLDVQVRDDLEGGVALIREALRRHDATDIASLRHSAAPYEPVPLH
ncbi:hypothetical protein [Actinomadura miaoliensis]